MAAILAPRELQHLPGGEIIVAGLDDVAAGRLTPAACAIWIAFARLSRAGLIDDKWMTRRLDAPEDALYRLLSEQGGNAHSRYNAFLRRLVRFEHALDRVMP